MEECTKFMANAIKLSEDNVKNLKGGPFGAVIVKEGKIVSSGVNLVTDSFDPTAHAEIVAIRKACEILGTFDLSGCEIYSSCEPCPMCLGAIYWARLGALYFANTKEDAASIGFDDAFIYDEINKSLESRTLATHHLKITHSMRAFQLWDSMEEKIKY
jgi:tRNA(Arg) A34 adenosine deaminase TadA